MFDTKNKQTTIAYKVSDNIKDQMIKYYEKNKCDKTPPYAIFQVKDFDCRIGAKHRYSHTAVAVLYCNKNPHNRRSHHQP